MAGEHDDAISSMDDLLKDVSCTSTLYVVQACERYIVMRSRTTNLSNRHICIFFLGTGTWRATTTSMRSSHFKMRELNSVTAFIHRH